MSFSHRIVSKQLGLVHKLISLRYQLTNGHQLRGFSAIASSRANIIQIGRSNKTPTDQERVAWNILEYNRARLIKTSTRSVGTQLLRPYVDPKLSYAFGRSNEHLIYSTAARQLDRCVAEKPNEVAYVSYLENKEITFQQLDEDINKLTKCLMTKFNIGKGDSVGVFAYNCYHWVLVQLTCSRIGAILTPINPSYKAHELAFVLKRGKVKCLFMPGPKSVQSELNDHMGILQSEKVLKMAESGEIKLETVILLDAENSYKITRDPQKVDSSDPLSIHLKLASCQMHNWDITQNDGQVFKTVEEAQEAGLKESEACIVSPDVMSPDDVFAVYYTSGTTGAPKGACISQFTAINNVRCCQIRLRHGRPKNWKITMVTILPMFHIFAGVLNALSPLVGDSVVIYSGYKYDIKNFVDAIFKYQANYITLTPTVLIDMLAYIETNKLTEVPLKIIQSGGAWLAPDVVERAFKTLPNLEELRTGYGSTENGSVATCQTIHEPFETRPFSVGPPMDFTEVRIVKAGTNDDVVPLGELGEVQTRGYNTMVEYLDQPDKTAEVLTPNRWYKTGDVGFMYPHGSISINGRIKEIIIKGGENIYPEEVEQLIHKLDCVEDVHVVGVPDKRFGEQVCAWVKLKEGYKEAVSEEGRSSDKEIHKNDIIKYCKDNITYFKVPKYLLFVDDFPMTPSRKAQKFIMSKRSCEILGLDYQK